MCFNLCISACLKRPGHPGTEVWVAVSHLMWVLENLRSSVKEVIYTSILSSPINDKQMVRGLASAAFLEYPSLVPDAHGRQLKIMCNSSSETFGVSGYLHSQTNTYPNTSFKTKIFKAWL